MKILSHSNSEFCVAHFQGKSMSSYELLVNEFLSRKITLDENISVITCFNNYDFAIFAQQLEKNNIPYINKVNPLVAWSNPLKLKYIYEALSAVTTPYVLICDGNDVVLSGNVGKNIIEYLNDNGLKMLYNATTNNHPNIVIDRIEHRDWLGKFGFFNAGTCIAKTEYAKEFYLKALELHESNAFFNPLQSEQFIIRHIFAKKLDNCRIQNEKCPISFDSECRYFQTFSNTHINKIDDNVYQVL